MKLRSLFETKRSCFAFVANWTSKKLGNFRGKQKETDQLKIGSMQVKTKLFVCVYTVYNTTNNPVCF